MNPLPTKLEILPGIEMMGRLIGKYRVMREIGRGGMGAVFEAVHEEVGQRLAVKVMHARLVSDTKAVKRFFDEAKAVSRVDHPGLVKLFDFNQLADGTIYIMMELLKGEPFSSRIERLRGEGKPLSRSEALFFVRQIASTLAAVHAEGIVHRDLKPENVILVPDPDSALGERIKIVDFGIAKFHEVPEGDRRTTEGAVLGTPIYMSPEQCRGAQKIDDRTDVYSLGVMLYELMGFPPFDDEGAGGIIAKHIYVEARPLREVDPSLPQPLTQLVHDMLSKDGAARPSMTEVVARINALDGVARAQTGSLTQLTALTTARPQRAWVVGGAILIAALVGAGLALQLRRPAPVVSKAPPPPAVTTTTTAPPPAAAPTPVAGPAAAPVAAEPRSPGGAAAAKGDAPVAKAQPRPTPPRPGVKGKTTPAPAKPHRTGLVADEEERPALLFVE